MPSKVTLFDAKCKAVYDLGTGPYNLVWWNPFGRFLAVAGFGNLPGGCQTFFWNSCCIKTTQKCDGGCDSGGVSFSTQPGKTDHAIKSFENWSWMTKQSGSKFCWVSRALFERSWWKATETQALHSVISTLISTLISFHLCEPRTLYSPSRTLSQ